LYIHDRGRLVKSLLQKIADRDRAICLYGLAPPKQATDPAALQAIVDQQATRLRALRPDGLILYDIQDESERTHEPRPFPFLPTIAPDLYADVHLAGVDLPKIVYRSVSAASPEALVQWLDAIAARGEPRLSVLVGAPSRRTAGRGVALATAYELARAHAPHLVVGGIAIAERHARTLDEHERMIAKTERGCRFLVTQAVYDVTSTKSLLSDYALGLSARGEAPVPIIVTLSPCGSDKTLAFMKWLGISFPRWLENELRHSSDTLGKSVRLCQQIFAELIEFARDKQLPLGVNVESVSIRKAEIDASVELFHALRALF
jgi:hypothetical protein